MVEPAAVDGEAEVRKQFLSLQRFLDTHIIGQRALSSRLLVALLADGHLLVEGAPGLAKTTAVKTLAQAIEGEFHRIQFTPDLLPADLTGTEVFRAQSGVFEFQHGPIFHNLLLADEINRAPAKVQSALLEAMGERQVTIGAKSYPLPRLFLVMATQNPIEQEGTYPLPEAQLDRFLMHVKVGYPDRESEQEILRLVREQAHAEAIAPSAGPAQDHHLDQAGVFAARRAALEIYLAPDLERYIVELVHATRSPGLYDADSAAHVRYGASPRATLALDRCARAHAWLHDRDYVSPEDIHAVAHEVLRHRIVLDHVAEARGVSADDIVGALLERVPVP